MKALHILEPGRTELREIDPPRPTEGEVLLRVGMVGFCGGDPPAWGTWIWARWVEPCARSASRVMLQPRPCLTQTPIVQPPKPWPPSKSSWPRLLTRVRTDLAASLGRSRR